MTPEVIKTFHSVCRTIVEESNNEYAKSYASAGLAMSDSEEIRVQCLYILNNLSHWRGAKAREVKAHLHQINKAS
jgi:hypothetical protein